MWYTKTRTFDTHEAKDLVHRPYFQIASEPKSNLFFNYYPTKTLTPNKPQHDNLVTYTF